MLQTGGVKGFSSVLASSILFGIGLEVSQMTNPQKVIGFLNIGGEWDPSLAFVMGGAILINSILYRLIIRKKHPIFGSEFSIPKNKQLTPTLIIGSAIFGVGWGTGGFCPGPALAGLFRGQLEIFIIGGSILAGMNLYSIVKKYLPN